MTLPFKRSENLWMKDSDQNTNKKRDITEAEPSRFCTLGTKMHTLGTN